MWPLIIQGAYVFVMSYNSLPNIDVRSTNDHALNPSLKRESKHSSLEGALSRALVAYVVIRCARVLAADTLGCLKATGATQPYNTPVNRFYTSQVLT